MAHKLITREYPATKINLSSSYKDKLFVSNRFFEYFFSCLAMEISEMMLSGSGSSKKVY